MIRFFLFALALSFWNTALFAQKSNQEVVNLGQQALLMKDYSYDPELVLQGKYDDSLRPIEENKPHHIIGNVIDSFWLKIKIPDPEADFYLTIGDPVGYRFRCFFYDSNRKLVVEQTGAAYTAEEKCIVSRIPVLFIKNLSMENPHLYIKIITSGAMTHLPVHKYSSAAFVSFYEKESYFYAGFHAILFVIFIINLFYFLATRNSIFLFYATYIFGAFLCFSSVDGTLALIIGGGPIIPYLQISFIVLYYTSMALMAFKFLELDTWENRWVYRFVLLLIVLFVIFSITEFFLPQYHDWYFKNGGILILYALILVVIIIIKGFRKNQMVGKLFLIATLILVVGNLVGNFHSYGIITVPLGMKWVDISIGIEVIILSLTLAVRFVRIEVISKKRLKNINLLTKEKQQINLQSLRLQMNPHFLFNTMNSIQSFIRKNESEEAVDYISKYSKLNRKILDNSLEELIPIESELEVLQLYIEIEQLRFDGSFEYKIEVDEQIEQDYEKIPPMILQPFVENAIWHGLMPKQGYKMLLVRLERKGEEGVLCIIEDNGIGRMESQRRKSKFRSEHKSHGLRISSNRLELVNAAEGHDLKIIDLEDDSGNPIGTRVEIFVLTQ